MVPYGLIHCLCSHILARKQNPHPWWSQENLSDSRQIWKSGKKDIKHAWSKSPKEIWGQVCHWALGNLATSVTLSQVVPLSRRKWPKHQAHTRCGISEQGALRQRGAAGVWSHRITGTSLYFYCTLRNIYDIHKMLQLGGGHPNTCPRTLG